MNPEDIINGTEEVQQPEAADENDLTVDECTMRAANEVKYFLKSAKSMVDELGLENHVDPEFYPRMLTIMQSQHQVHKGMELQRRMNLGV